MTTPAGSSPKGVPAEGARATTPVEPPPNSDLLRPSGIAPTAGSVGEDDAVVGAAARYMLGAFPIGRRPLRTDRGRREPG
jgi:hypothetical protein